MLRQLRLFWDIVYGAIISLAIIVSTRLVNYGVYRLEAVFLVPGADQWYTYLKDGLNIISILSAIVVYALLAVKSIWSFIRDWRREARQKDE